MGLVLLTLIMAVLVGLLLGGRLGRPGRLERLPVRGLPLLAAAAASCLAGWSAPLLGLPVRWTYAPALAVAGALAWAFSARGRTLYGAGLVGAGLLANALVLFVDAGMPVSAGAAARAGVPAQRVTADPRLVPAGPGTALRPFGAVIPVPLPVRPEVASVGDLLVLAGVAQLVVTAMLPRRAGPAGPATRYARRPGPAAAAGDAQPPDPALPTPPTLPVGPIGPIPPIGPAGLDGTGHVRVLTPRPRTEGEPLPRAGPT